MSTDAATPAGNFAESDDPFALFDQWFGEAERHEINDPNAMVLATADRDGLPNARAVLLKGVDGADRGDVRGFTWFTNYESVKGHELADNAQAALLFYWKSLRRQIRLRGTVTQTPDQEGDAYFASRSRGSQLGAWASLQSRPLESMAELQAVVDQMAARFPEPEAVPRPPHWSGYRLVPLEIEFWHDRPYRLHERVVFRRDSPGQRWTKQRLYP